MAVVALAATAGSVLAYGARRELARDALTGWLQSRGVESEVEFSTFDFGTVDGRLRIGSRADPDVVAELAEVRYGLGGFWNRQPFGVRVASVRLVRPVVKASFKGGKLSLGSLDPLLDELSKKPPQPDRGQPTIVIEGGRIALATDYGRLSARADARLVNGRLILLDAKVAPAILRGKDLNAVLGETEVRAATTGSRLDILVRAPLKTLTAGQASARDLQLALDAQGPYPDFKKQRGQGRVFVRLVATGEAAAFADTRIDQPRINAQFDGASAGWIDTLTLSGDAEATLAGDRVQTKGLDAQALNVRARATALKWNRKTQDLAAQVWAETAVGAAKAGDIRLARTTARVSGPAAWRAGEVGFTLAGLANGQGGWSGLGPVTRADPPETASLKRALADFRFDAPAFEIALAKGAVTAAVAQPVRVRTASGGEAVLTPVGGRALYANGAGAAHLTVKGGGLPTVDLAVSDYRTTPSGLTAAVALDAAGSFGPLIDADLKTSGRFSLTDGAMGFTAAGCVPLKLTRLEMGETDIKAISGQLCPTAAPTFTFADGAWRVRGLAKDVSATVPFLELKADDVAGPVDLGGKGDALRVEATIRTAALTDTAAERRFNPVRASGNARLAGGVWRAGFTVTDPVGRKLGDATLAQTPNGQGRLDFDTGPLTFAEGGLQPANLSPLAAPIASPAVGEARFAGQIGWAPGTSTSGGTLDIARLDFKSPAGKVTGLSGKVAFTSLVPLAAAPGQTLHAENIATLLPLTDASIVFGLGEETLKVEGASFDVGGGKLVLEPFGLPFAPGATWNGVIDFQGVQIKDLVETSPFGDKVDLEAKLTGRVPFQVTPDGVRVTNGTLRAIEPGRLSIEREALTAVQATGGAVATAPAEPAAAPDPYSDFVYQALEHLVFQELDATLNSQDEGRLGIRFHIKGEHSPPVNQQIRLTLREIITRKVTRTLPLPKGTKVDLTLDTSINLDQLLRDFTDIQTVRGSQAVQP